MKLRILFTAAVMLGALAAFAENVPPRDIWPLATGAAFNGDTASATKKTSDLVVTGKSYGINSYPLYASSAAAMARQLNKSGPKASAPWAVKAADLLDSKSAAVAFSNADMAWDQRNWPRVAQSLVAGFGRLPANYRARVLSESDLLIAIALAAALSAAVFSLALFIRYGKSMAHDLREMVGQKLHGGAVTVVAFALLFLPIFLWMGPVWLVLYWFVIFFSYATKLERAMIIMIALVLGALPILVDRVATRIAGVDSPVMMAAIASTEQSYHPAALRRMQELTAIIPDDDTLQILLGNLQLQDGNEKQAQVHYARAAEIRDSAGAHVNLGNLHFLDNDFAAAITEYAKAEQLDPRLAIAYYNDSVAHGETYKFQEQGQKLEKAKSIDRARIERIIQTQASQSSNAPKIVIYTPPMEQAWAVSDKVALRSNARAIFGTYPYFDLKTSALNPLTLGSIASVIFAVALWVKRRKAGFANACIKCGRTFCPRCKSARESATYCTQCIHIYLKRDGVSLDTKRNKLDEVHRYHSGMLKRHKLFASFLPGSAQLMEGRVLVGLVGTFLFLLFVSIAVLTGRLAPILGPAAEAAKLAVRVGTILLAIVTWFIVSMPVYRRRPTA